jgi:hypothetical protein
MMGSPTPQGPFGRIGILNNRLLSVQIVSDGNDREEEGQRAADRNQSMRPQEPLPPE